MSAFPAATVSWTYVSETEKQCLQSGEWPPKPTEKPGPNKTVIVGAVLGSVLGVALIVFIATLPWCHFRGPSRETEEGPLT
jgi:hypothetical protein